MIYRVCKFLGERPNGARIEVAAVEVVELPGHREGPLHPCEPGLRCADEGPAELL